MKNCEKNIEKTSKKNGKVLNIITIVLAILMSVSIVALGVIVTISGTLPLKWLILAWCVAAILIFLALFIAFKKRKIKRWLKIVDCALCGIFTVVSIVGAVYLINTMIFLGGISGPNYRTEVFDVVALKDSEIEKIEDVKGKNVGVSESTEGAYQTAIEKLNETVSTEKTEYSDYFEMAQGLTDQAVSAIFLPDTNYDIIDEFDKDFGENTKIIYTIEIQVEIEGEEDDNTDITSAPFNVFISGIDSYGDISVVARSDVNMIVSVNPTTHKILLTSIPRDYYVQLHGTTGLKDKLTHAGIYGIDMSVSTVSDLLNTDIKYYIRVNFSSMVDIIDAIGGIEIESDMAFTAKADKSCKFVVGTQHVDGACALAFARERKAYATGDRHRLLNQQEVLSKTFAKVASSETILTKYFDILGALGGSIQTNIPTGKIYSLINYQLDQMPSWSIDKYSLDGTGDMQPTYSMGSQTPLYVMQPDQTTVDTAITKINDVISTDSQNPDSTDE